ncbi:MAG: Coenzyme F420 hydrogenase/dehydrogenase, beta subunit C-terminal domain, partial [Bacteroidota bacterium]
MEKICSENECYGCSACFNICPVKCITMVSDSEGFLQPKIDSSRCIDCRKCISVCQVYENRFIAKQFEQKYYAVKADDAIRKNSSSGGMFTVLSDYIFANGGFVVGVGYDEQFKVIHKIVDNAESCNNLRNSKYVQSDLTEIFQDIRTLLLKDKLVLFTGLPCQVEGLNLFLGKSFENLITVDLICHGAPSPAVFKSFIEYIQEKETRKLLDFKFRDKRSGWRGYNVTAIFKKKIIKKKLWLRSFNYLFSRILINRR